MKSQLLMKLFCALLVIASTSWAQANLIEMQVNQSIPDGDLSGLASTINLSGLSIPVGNLEVELNISGTYNGDLYAYLTHGSGFAVLLNRVGTTSGNDLGYGDHGFNVTFANSAPDIHNYQVVLAGSGSLPLTGPLTGTWGPDGRAVSPLTVTDADSRSTFLSSFQGLDPNGSWTLFVADVNGGDLHQLASWGLEFNAPITRIPDGGATAMLLVMGLAGVFVAAWGRRWVRCNWAVVMGLAMLLATNAELNAGLGGRVTGWGDLVMFPLNGYGARFTAVSAGEGHKLALRTDGTVVAWGSNDSGQCNVPAGLSQVIAIAAGPSSPSYSLALKEDGTVVAWGSNSGGQCDVPIGLTGAIAIAAGDWHCLALKADGSVVAWGSNISGETVVPDGLGNVVGIAAGQGFSVALKADGTVVAWGYNGSGESDVPGGLSGVVAISASGSHTLALKGDGTVVGWGYNVWDLTVTRGLSGIISVSAGPTHNLAVKSDGTVLGWGACPPDGGCGIPNGLSGVIAVAAGVYFQSLALKADGSILVWGDNGALSGPTGLDDVIEIAMPLMLKSDGTTVGWSDSGELSGVVAIAANGPRIALTGSGAILASELGWPTKATDVPAGLTSVSAIAVGVNHAMALREDGTVVVWGDGTGNSDVPAGLKEVVAIAGGGHAEVVKAGPSSDLFIIDHSLALRADSTVVAWGSIRDVPSGLTGVVAISAGAYHALALKRDGTIVAWGGNESHQCDVPSGLTDVIAIAAGGKHSLALKPDGTVVAWGNNDFGQCNIPAGLSNVTAIAAGYQSSLALFNAPNSPPRTAGYYAAATENRPASMSLFKLHHACSDPDWDSFIITDVSPTSVAGGTAQMNGGTILYTPPKDFIGNDSFTYSVRDSRGASSQGTVNVTVSAPSGSGPNIIDVTMASGGAATIHCAGIPVVTYTLEASTDLVHWMTVGSARAGANGLFDFVDLEAGNYTSGSYRTVTGSNAP